MDLINCNVKRVVLPICSVVKFTTYPRASLTILKTCGLFKHWFKYPIQIHTYSSIRSFSMLLKPGLTGCSLFEVKIQITTNFASVRLIHNLHISCVLIRVKWTQAVQEQTHRRWTHIYCVLTKAVFSRTWKAGCTNTALSFLIPAPALGVGDRCHSPQNSHTHAL